MIVIRGIMPRIYCTCERRFRKCWNAGSSPTMPIGLKPDLMGQSQTWWTKARLQLVQAKATLSSDLGPNFSDERATMRPPSAR